jgi:hypothetical protein
MLHSRELWGHPLLVCRHSVSMVSSRVPLCESYEWPLESTPRLLESRRRWWWCLEFRASLVSCMGKFGTYRIVTRDGLRRVGTTLGWLMTALRWVVTALGRTVTVSPPKVGLGKIETVSPSEVGLRQIDTTSPSEVGFMRIRTASLMVLKFDIWITWKGLSATLIH